jgi:hypothetical protein
MFIACIRLYEKTYENFESNKIQSFGLQGKGLFFWAIWVFFNIRQA